MRNEGSCPGRTVACRAVGSRHQPEKIQEMARSTGLEPATSGVTGRHSNQLSYDRAVSCNMIGNMILPAPSQAGYSSLISRRDRRVCLPCLTRRNRRAAACCCAVASGGQSGRRRRRSSGRTMPDRATEWWVMRDSNSRHLRCKRSALPLS